MIPADTPQAQVGDTGPDSHSMKWEACGSRKAKGAVTAPASHTQRAIIVPAPASHAQRAIIVPAPFLCTQ